MKTIYEKEEFFQNRIECNATESNLYRENGIVYKFLFSHCREGRERILILLNKNHIVTIPKLYDLIRDEITEEFIGYSMKDLCNSEVNDGEGFITLFNFFNTGFKDRNGIEMPFENRQKAALSLIKGLRELESYDYQHRDLHARNIMIKNNECKIIDVDSMLLDKKNSFVDKYMEQNIMYFIAIILLKYKSIYYVDIHNEFKNDPIIMTLINHQNFFPLIAEGYKVEDIYNGITEETCDKYSYVMKGKR